MKFSISSYRIDWPNHIIGFFSALFGILIAFELEGWRDQKSQAETVFIAFENLKKEIQNNQTTLHENVSANINHISKLQGLLSRMDNGLRFSGSLAEIDSVNRNFGQVIFIEKMDPSSKNKDHFVHIGMGNIVVPSLQTSAWESAKATGALNLMNYEKVLTLSSLYNPPRLLDELTEIRTLWRTSDNVVDKQALTILLADMEKAHRSLQNELQMFDQFVNILNAME